MRFKKIYKPGDVIASLYEVREIFDGGMGEVYLSYHRERKRLYILKTIQEKYFLSKEEFLAFRREAEVWIMMEKHPHIVQAISVRQKFPKLYKRMEDEGEDMGKIYKRAVFPLSPKIFFVFEVRG